MATIRYLTRVEAGAGVRRELGAILKAAGCTRPLIVTDKGVRDAGVLDMALEGLGTQPAAIFDGTPANPTEAAGREAALLYRETGADGLVGIGGGSPMDLTKAVAVLIGDDGPLERHAFHNAGLTPTLPKLPPMVLMPTTSGTGAEVGRAAIMIFESGRKAVLAVGTEAIVAAICDPELTYGLPRGLTAATGLDAISHCVETYCSPRVNPVADAIALDGLARLLPALPRVLADGSDAEARADMMLGATEGAMAFQKGLGAVHAISHPLGAYGFHHGTLNAILMPYVMDWNATALEGRTDRLAAVCGVQPGDLPLFFRDLANLAGLPTDLSGLDTGAVDWDTVAAYACEDTAHGSNPRPMDRDTYRRVIDRALAGTLG